MDMSNSTPVPAEAYHVLPRFQLKFSTSARSVLPRNMCRQSGGLLNSRCSAAFARIRLACRSEKAVAKVF